MQNMITKASAHPLDHESIQFPMQVDNMEDLEQKIIDIIASIDSFRSYFLVHAWDSDTSSSFLWYNNVILFDANIYTTIPF